MFNCFLSLFVRVEVSNAYVNVLSIIVFFSISFNFLDMFLFLKKWENVEKYCRARQATRGNVVWCMHIAWWVTKATDTHSEYVILIAFPQQKWLHKCTSMLRYTYTAALFHTDSFFVGWCCTAWQRPSYRDQAGKWSRRSTCEQNRECSEDHTSANRWKLNLVLGDNETTVFFDR